MRLTRSVVAVERQNALGLLGKGPRGEIGDGLALTVESRKRLRRQSRLCPGAAQPGVGEGPTRLGQFHRQLAYLLGLKGGALTRARAAGVPAIGKGNGRLILEKGNTFSRMSRFDFSVYIGIRCQILEQREAVNYIPLPSRQVTVMD